MATLTMTKGVPGSGKSFWADEESHRTGAQIVNKDAIRADLERTGWVWSKGSEQRVIHERNRQLRQYLMNGVDAISADTNFGRHESDLRALAQECNADFVIKEFRTPLDVCLERNAAREKPVPTHVITGMAKASGWYSAPAALDVEPYANSSLLPQAVICDLDGTAALFSHHRGPYEHMKCGGDAVNRPVLMVMKGLFHNGLTGTQFFYLSGRDEECRKETDLWLKREFFPPGILLMRSHGDQRKDSIVKLELFNTFIRDKYHVTAVFDDRPQVLRMWRQLGLFTFAVGPLEEF